MLATVLSSLVAGVVLVTLPADYLRVGDVRERHWTLRIVRNLVGVLVVAIGVLLSVPGVPGQGLLTILAGATLIDFPGRHRLVRFLIGRPAALRALNRLRARFGRPPLTL
ncbi:MAG TPA: hypothetical protein VHZ49_16215 [Methylomirabilota bacterium]|nr:hypothetical protein [Methylomirabilota bacterium]